MVNLHIEGLIHTMRFFLIVMAIPAQDSKEVFTLCDCDNITNSYTAHYEQEQIAVTNRTV